MTSDTLPLAPPHDAPEADVPADPFPGEFRILRKLGGGGFGVVFEALDLSPLGRRVALKFVSPRASLARSLPALRNEGRLLAPVRHPNIVPVHAWKTTATGLPCLVMEYVSGGSLDGVVDREGPLPWKRAARYIADITTGLKLLHERGIVHRDIKPDNMLLDAERDEALLTDLGIAARLSEEAPSAGTIPYMSPEAFDGHVSPALDVYALAASLFTLMAGERPFKGNDPITLIAACQDGLPDPDPRLAGVPAPLEDLLRNGLAADLSRRPSLSEFSARLRGTLNALMADSLATAGGAVRIIVSRLEGTVFVPVAASTAVAANTLRDMKRVPEPPRRLRLHTGDRVRITAEADRPGHITVFNVGPTGNLNLLSAEQTPIRPGEPLRVLDVELTPPAGNERLFALWTAGPVPLRLEEMRSLVEQSGAGAYRATRDLARVQQTVACLPPDGRAAAVVELEHVNPVGDAT